MIMETNSINNDVFRTEQYIPQTKTVNMETPKQTDNQEHGSNDASREGGSSQEEALIKAIEKANNLTSQQTQCQFSVHERTKQIVVKIVDPQTKEVIKEIPSEKILNMVADMCELAGLFVDEKR